MCWEENTGFTHHCFLLIATLSQHNCPDHTMQYILTISQILCPGGGLVAQGLVLNLAPWVRDIQLFSLLGLRQCSPPPVISLSWQLPIVSYPLLATGSYLFRCNLIWLESWLLSLAPFLSPFPYSFVSFWEPLPPFQWVKHSVKDILNSHWIKTMKILKWSVFVAYQCWWFVLLINESILCHIEISTYLESSIYYIKYIIVKELEPWTPEAPQTRAVPCLNGVLEWPRT